MFAAGGFDTETWRSTGIDYSVEVSSDAPADQLAHLLEVVDQVAEIPRAIRAGATVRWVCRAVSSSPKSSRPAPGDAHLAACAGTLYAGLRCTHMRAHSAGGHAPPPVPEPGTPDKPHNRQGAGRPRRNHLAKLFVQESGRKRATAIDRWIEA